MLKTFREGQLVTVAAEEGTLDGVVAQVLSLVRVEVAVQDANGDAVFRTAHPKSLTPRDAAGETDDVLRRLIHRGTAASHGAPGGGSARGRRAHTRGAAHRTTGR
jgi:hypothetical protein